MPRVDSLALDGGHTLNPVRPLPLGLAIFSKGLFTNESTLSVSVRQGHYYKVEKILCSYNNLCKLEHWSTNVPNAAFAMQTQPIFP